MATQASAVPRPCAAAGATISSAPARRPLTLPPKPAPLRLRLPLDTRRGVSCAGPRRGADPTTPPRAVAPSGPASDDDGYLSEGPPPGCARYSVELSKPLGIVLEERPDIGSIVVAELVPGGAAEATGLVGVGDILIATTGYTRMKQVMYGETRVQSGEKIVRLRTTGEKFSTVLAAISSVPSQIKVKLEFQRCT